MVSTNDISINIDLNENESFCKKSLINYEIVQDMLSLSCLVYNFNISIKTEMCSESKMFDLDNLKIDTMVFDSKKQAILNNILSKSPNCELHKFYDLESGTQVGVAVSHKMKRISIIFRGSNELVDWMHNLLICKQRLPNGKYIHQGFYKSLFMCDLYYKLRNDFINLTKKYPDYEVYVSGHSLGGGLATLFSYFISNITEKDITLITFASPRVGNKNWADDFNSRKNLRHYRFVNQKDIVTSIPYFYFHHVGNCIEINSNNEIKYSIFDIHKDIQNIFKYFNIFDHLIENYYSNLLKCKWKNDYIHCKYDEKVKNEKKIDIDNKTMV